MESYINIDPNMAVERTVGDAEVVWFDIKQTPFTLHGFYEPLTEPFYRRVPAEVADATSTGVSKLAKESVGGRVRFSTNSPYVAIRAKFLAVGRSPHLTLISSSGFDLYSESDLGTRFVKEFRMPYDMTDSYEQLIKTGTEQLRSYTLNFPVHAVVESLEVGLKPESVLGAPAPYRDMKPVIFYGSSIVHGTGASRPGGTYPSIISREMNLDYMNLGFSGNAKGESVLGEWMADLPMSIFVCDYDHNAPTADHLKQTHYPLYEIIRAKNPDVPYIMITRPDCWSLDGWEGVLRRRDVIMSSYLRARENGDKNVYFIDGMSFYSVPHQYELSLDSCHPNDTGYVMMAERIGTVIRHILERG